ncbi:MULTISPECIES: hypothetical protein [Flavobacterium]|uniref:Uncharacterized protein n=1 Tax=Flavobacterium keumense TaxID=1306518 RepID=A0ABY8N7I9_9FLAO|nr:MULTISPECIES: hypothetical protein [Flavobacterium]WGK95143.1 hypothetical protein MG292_02625 [Flavobacterium keumense]
MKFLGIIYLVFCGFILPQESMIKGRYEMQFEEEFNSQNCIVNFDGNIYKRKLSDGKTVKGKIEYSNQRILLKDTNTSLQMEFYKDEMPNDTIYFKTKDLKNKNKGKEGEIVIYSGKLIRVKW